MSVKARLLNLARESGEDFNSILVRYGIERLLFRLSRSTHADRFVLKGAMLFHLFAQTPFRPTKDIDLLGQGSVDLEKMVGVIREVVSQTASEDGLTFDIDAIVGVRIKEGQEYEGVRISLPAYLGSARIPLQLDVGFGDAVTPEPELRDFPSMLDFGVSRLRIYPWETVVAEKYQALVQLGMMNSRMKDFFDLHYLAQQMSFEGITLGKAIVATFERRNTTLPRSLPVALTADFANDEIINKRWLGFVRRLHCDDLPLSRVIEEIRLFLEPLNAQIATGEPFPRRWQAGGPWR